jgi:hypothetical protein
MMRSSITAIATRQSVETENMREKTVKCSHEPSTPMDGGAASITCIALRATLQNPKMNKNWPAPGLLNLKAEVGITGFERSCLQMSLKLVSWAMSMAQTCMEILHIRTWKSVAPNFCAASLETAAAEADLECALQDGVAR